MKNRSYFDHLALIFYELFFAAPKERQPKREVKRVENEENNNERNSWNKVHVKGWIRLVMLCQGIPSCVLSVENSLPLRTLKVVESSYRVVLYS